MALQLKLDGKDIGTIDNDGHLTDADGRTVNQPAAVPDGEKMTVPLGPPRPMDMVPDNEPDDNEPDDNEPISEPEPNSDLADIKEQISSLQSVVTQMMNNPNTQTPQNVQKVKQFIEDHIPNDSLTQDKDPYGFARTMKGVVKAINEIGNRVERLDQHAGYTEAMKQLNAEKANHEVFKDPKLGPIADQVLQVELSQSAEPPAVVVQRVAKKFQGLGTTAGKKYVKEKTKQLEKVPGTMRSKDGTTPAITINKPKNVKEAADAYAAWRGARARAANKG